MSQTLNIDNMAADLQERMPMGLTTARCFSELNAAWRKIESQGAFVWNVLNTTLTMALNTRVLTLPSDVDPGKPISIHKFGVTFRYPIKFLPLEDFTRQQLFHISASPAEGYFSAWTFLSSGVNAYQALFVPVAAQPTVNTDYSVFYHHMVGPPKTAGQFFPTPDAFDDTIVDLAEGEIKRLYSIVGWDIAVREAETAMKILCDKYRSPRENLAGIQEESMTANETALERAK